MSPPPSVSTRHNQSPGAGTGETLLLASHASPPTTTAYFPSPFVLSGGVSSHHGPAGGDKRGQGPDQGTRPRGLEPPWSFLQPAASSARSYPVRLRASSGVVMRRIQGSLVSPLRTGRVNYYLDGGRVGEPAEPPPALGSKDDLDLVAFGFCARLVPRPISDREWGRVCRAEMG